MNSISSSLAPVSVPVYTRFNHFKRCIKSLAQNSLASDTTLFIFSDGPKKGDENKVDTVRSFANSITGFKDVELYFQKHNNLDTNLTKACTLPYERNGKIILLEDDCIVSPHFLSFMNLSLDYFRYDPSIISVSGYSPPINLYNYTSHDHFKSKFFNAWGYGSWIDRNIHSVISQNSFYTDMKNNNLKSKVSLIHPKLPKLLKKIEGSHRRAGDIKLTYHMIKNDLYQIRPTLSLVKNIGFDGSGINCGFRDEFNTQEISKQKKFAFSHTKHSPKIDEEIYKYYHEEENIFIRLKNKLLNNLANLTDKYI